MGDDAVIVSPVHCGDCGDYGVTETDEPCECGGPVAVVQVAALRRAGWWAYRESWWWNLYRILDDETDDRGPILSGVRVRYRNLDVAVEALCR